MDELALVPVGVVLETTRVIIDSIWSHFEREASNAVSQLRDEDKFETLVSVDFSRFLHEIKAHSKHCPDFILKKLIDWRQQRMLSVHHKFDTDPNTENPTRSLYSIAVNIIYVRSVLMVVTSHNIAQDLSLNLQNQAFQCFCDVVPLQRSTTMAKFASKIFNKSSINTDYYNVSNSAPLAQKRRLLFNLWCTLLGYLSQTQLESIMGRLQDLMKETEENHAKAKLIRGMRSLKLNLSDISSITKSYNLIRYILSEFNGCHSSEIKRAVGETLTLILYPLAEQIPTFGGLAVREWWKTVYDVYVMAENWSKKRKYHNIALPLMMSALCVMEKESFLSHRLMCCNKLYKFIKEHNNNNSRSIGLACVRRILETYLRHFADGQTGTETHLQNLNHQILFELKWDPLHTTLQDGIVSYILTIAERKPALALATIVSSCLEMGAKNRHCLAGLRALNAILYGGDADINISNANLNSTHGNSTHSVLNTPMNNTLTRTPIVITNIDNMTSAATTFNLYNNNNNDINPYNDEESDRSDLLHASDDTIETTYGPHLSNVLKTLIHKIKPVSDHVLEPDIEGILCAAISQILRETKSVMLRHGSIKGSSVEIYSKDGGYLEMFRLCILCLPRLHLWSSLIRERDEYDVLSTSDLIYLLAMSSISQHERIASSAQHVLVYLMMYHPELRCCVLQDTSTYLLQQHGDNVSNISTLLRMLDEFIQIWLSQMDATKQTRYELSQMDISKVEAACVFSLTSTSSVVRQAALNVIDLCNELGKSQPKNVNTTAINQESKTKPQDDGSSSSSHSQSFVLQNVHISSSTATNNNRWPDIRLQEIINATENDMKQRIKRLNQYKFGHESEIKAKSIYDLASGEASQEQLEWTMCLGAILQKAVPKRCRCLKFAYDNGKMHVDAVLKYVNNNEFDENMIGIWTNFVLFITICVAIIDPIPGAAEELFQRLIPLLSMDRPDIQFMAALALGKIDPTMILTLMKCLESIQHSVFSLRKKPKHFIRLLQNLAYIYRFLAEDVEKSTILQSETIRERMISFVEKTMKFMEEFRANLRPDCLTIRIHFCIIVRNLLEKWPAISQTQNNKDGLDPIPARLRRRLFDFMISWSGQNQRKNNNFNPLKSSATKSIIKARHLHPYRVNDYLQKQSNQQKLEFSALAAIASLLRGQSFELEIASLRDGVVFKWIRTVVASADPEVARLGSLALQSYLSCNYDDVEDFIEECYNNNHIISKTFFVVLCDVWLNDHFNIPKPVLFHLAIYKMGDISMRVRSAALKIGREIPCLIPPEQPINPLNFIISSRLPDSYIPAQEELSGQLAAAYPSLSPSIIREFGNRLNEAEMSYVGVMLNYMVPWLEKIELTNEHDNDFVMDILFRATIDYGTQYAHQITKTWKGLTFKQDNIPIVLDYVLRRCEYDIEYDKWVGIEASKRIALYCSRMCRKYTIQHLIRIINNQSVDSSEFLDDMSDVMTEVLPEDPRTSLSTPAPPPYKRFDDSPFRSALFTGEQLQLIQNDEYSDAPSIFEDEIRRFNANHEHKRNPKSKPGLYDIETIHAQDAGVVQCSSITKGDYALMLLVELAYEMDPMDDDFTENLALMLHVAVLGLDHPFRSLGEHCKRLLMNLIHSIHFRQNNNDYNDSKDNANPEYPKPAQELMLFLVSRRGKLMWQREMICPQQLYLTSSRYLQFLVQWLIDVVTDKKCENTSTFWGNAAIEWVEKCTSSFIACRSIQIYRSLQKSFDKKFNKRVFDILMTLLQDATKFSLWSEILILMRTWTIHIPTTDTETWCKLIWNTINICRTEPSYRPHVYIHGLSLLASILQFLHLSGHNNSIWDLVISDITNNMIDINAERGKKTTDFDGIQSLVIKGLLCETTRKHSEQFLSGLTLMEEHEMISTHLARVHMTVIAQLPGICYYLQQKNIFNMTIQKHMQSMSRCIATLFYQLDMKEVALPFDNVQHLDVDKFLSKTLKSIAEWISLTPSADINTVRLLLDLLEHTDTEYRRQVLCILHGILLWIEWEESALSEVDSNFFDRITDLLATNLWREATMILEVVVKFNNNSSESPSLLFSPDPNIVPSPRKGLLSLDPQVLEYNHSSQKQIDYHNPSKLSTKLECADHKGGFQPSKVSKDMPPFSPNNVRTKQLQQQKRKLLRSHKRRYSDSSPPTDAYDMNMPCAPWTPQQKKNAMNAADTSQMVPSALASWRLVIEETRNETYCSPLPPGGGHRNQNKTHHHEHKVVAALLQKSASHFKLQHKDEPEKPSFSARRSLDKLLSFSGLNLKNGTSVNSSFSNYTPSGNKRALRSFYNESNNNNNNGNGNASVIAPSRSASIEDVKHKSGNHGIADKENIQNRKNPYIDQKLMSVQQRYAPKKNQEFEKDHAVVSHVQEEDNEPVNIENESSAKQNKSKVAKSKRNRQKMNKNVSDVIKEANEDEAINDDDNTENVNEQ